LAGLFGLLSFVWLVLERERDRQVEVSERYHKKRRKKADNLRRTPPFDPDPPLFPPAETHTPTAIFIDITQSVLFGLVWFLSFAFGPVSSCLPGFWAFRLGPCHAPWKSPVTNARYVAMKSAPTLLYNQLSHLVFKIENWWLPPRIDAEEFAKI